MALIYERVLQRLSSPPPPLSLTIRSSLFYSFKLQLYPADTQQPSIEWQRPFLVSWQDGYALARTLKKKISWKESPHHLEASTSQSFTRSDVSQERAPLTAASVSCPVWAVGKRAGKYRAGGQNQIMQESGVGQNPFQNSVYLPKSALFSSKHQTAAPAGRNLKRKPAHAWSQHPRKERMLRKGAPRREGVPCFSSIHRCPCQAGVNQPSLPGTF